MSTSSDKYEKSVREFANDIASSSEMNLMYHPRYGRTNKIKGASGHRHQIDVSIEYISRDGRHILHLFECKFLSVKINLQDALIFHSRINDIQRKVADDNIHVMGNFVTTLGYTTHAKKYADFYGIATNTLAKDHGAGSISYADNVVIQVRTANLKAIAGNLRNRT